MSAASQTESELTPEYQLLLACARVELTPNDHDRIAALTQQPMAWDVLGREATRHGLLPLLHRQLKACSPPTCPAKWLRTWGQDSLHLLARNLGLVAELAAVGKLLAEAQVPFLCLKGPSLASAAYGNLRLRPFSDLDILVRPEHARRACEQISRRGFVPQFTLSGKWWDLFLRTRSELTFQREHPLSLAEVHWGLLPPGYTFTPTASPLWERAEDVVVESLTVRTLGRDDNLLFLCLHAAKHSWERMIWLVDLAELLRRRPDVDWDRLLAEANRRAAGRMLALSLFLAAQLLDAPVPVEVLDGLRRVHSERLAQRVIRDKLVPRTATTQPAVTAPWREHYYQAMASRCDKLRYVHDVLLQPTPIEWQLCPLPAWLAPACYVIRPIRLLWRQAMRGCGDRRLRVD